MRFFSLPLICSVALTAVPVPAPAKLNVVASTPDLASIAKEIGGEHIDISTLAKPTEDPHFVDAKPSFIVKLNRADVLIEGGAELEIGWLPALLDQSRNTKLAGPRSEERRVGKECRARWRAEHGRERVR